MRAYAAPDVRRPRATRDFGTVHGAGLRTALAEMDYDTPRHGGGSAADRPRSHHSGPARAAVVKLMRRASPPTAVLALNLGISAGVLVERIASRRSFALVSLDEHELSMGLGVSAVVRDPRRSAGRRRFLPSSGSTNRTGRHAPLPCPAS